ncbi:sarcosine oxidase subunit gamma [Jiella marina]|uniref:sarcosine oxidase subunit gamma n=1 Tax=Jiella sp. LLJ827 TaxID=2917712 RepID=UPI002101AAF9|nr:sarcosine oxidase subunit gamma family protein [Jiella sp. LLJ827]MCQ0986664.1 sarcosine oxidase subunit gamma [Jiella sp. LLJ827]
MLEVNVARRTPAVAPMKAASHVRVEPIGPEGRLSFRAKESALAGQSEVAGFRVDGAMNSRTVSGDRAALRLGPDEWLFTCPAADLEEVAEAISTTMDNRAFSLVDVSHRDVSFLVEGEHADFVINAGAPIDLSLRSFPVGAATRTILAKSDIVLTRLAEDSFKVTCWRSFATYVHGFLVEAAKDFA